MKIMDIFCTVGLCIGVTLFTMGGGPGLLNIEVRRY